MLSCCSVACRHYKNSALDEGTTTNSALHLTLQYFEYSIHLVHNYGMHNHLGIQMSTLTIIASFLIATIKSTYVLMPRWE